MLNLALYLIFFDHYVCTQSVFEYLLELEKKSNTIKHNRTKQINRNNQNKGFILVNFNRPFCGWRHMFRFFYETTGKWQARKVTWRLPRKSLFCEYISWEKQFVSFWNLYTYIYIYIIYIYVLNFKLITIHTHFLF